MSRTYENQVSDNVTLCAVLWRSKAVVRLMAWPSWSAEEEAENARTPQIRECDISVVDESEREPSFCGSHIAQTSANRHPLWAFMVRDPLGRDDPERKWVQWQPRNQRAILVKELLDVNLVRILNDPHRKKFQVVQVLKDRNGTVEDFELRVHSDDRTQDDVDDGMDEYAGVSFGPYKELRIKKVMWNPNFIFHLSTFFFFHARQVAQIAKYNGWAADEYDPHSTVRSVLSDIFFPGSHGLNLRLSRGILGALGRCR
ncbi:hypothetical protein AJ80_04690 [Polytolypa hystricis UAMH7299]|uniref:Uncharacterized protein n=1 Tax=Polytolypa hystricis (strain UAMH7299) TaxID=1447883 RepID=A0A2B7Y8N2_POLH7|nr:hypothetical protein AJ80_04690 [Polytolypa hystricis UAMH7299]